MKRTTLMLVCVLTIAIITGIRVFAAQGCGHCTGDNFDTASCDGPNGSGGVPCSPTAFCAIFIFPPGYYKGSCSLNSVETAKCNDEGTFNGNVTERDGDCQADCSCWIDTPGYEAPWSGPICNNTGKCTGG